MISSLGLNIFDPAVYSNQVKVLRCFGTYTGDVSRGKNWPYKSRAKLIKKMEKKNGRRGGGGEGEKRGKLSFFTDFLKISFKKKKKKFIYLCLFSTISFSYNLKPPPKVDFMVF